MGSVQLFQVFVLFLAATSSLAASIGISRGKREAETKTETPVITDDSKATTARAMNPENVQISGQATLPAEGNRTGNGTSRCGFGGMGGFGGQAALGGLGGFGGQAALGGLGGFGGQAAFGGMGGLGGLGSFGGMGGGLGGFGLADPTLTVGGGMINPAISPVTTGGVGMQGGMQAGMTFPGLNAALSVNGGVPGMTVTARRPPMMSNMMPMMYG